MKCQIPSDKKKQILCNIQLFHKNNSYLCSLLPADSLRHASAISVLLAAFFVAICSVMAIHALWVGETKTPRLFPDFGAGVSVFSLFTTIPVFATAFGCHVNGKKYTQA